MSDAQINELEGQKYESNGRLLLQIGGHLRKKREALGMTAAQLAERAEISTAQILRLELGDWDIDVVSLVSVTRCLHTTPGEMFEDIERSVFQLEANH